MSHYDNVDNAEMPGDAENWVSGAHVKVLLLLLLLQVASCIWHSLLTELSLRSDRRVSCILMGERQANMANKRTAQSR